MNGFAFLPHPIREYMIVKCEKARGESTSMKKREYIDRFVKMTPISFPNSFVRGT